MKRARKRRAASTSRLLSSAKSSTRATLTNDQSDVTAQKPHSPDPNQDLHHKNGTTGVQSTVPGPKENNSTASRKLDSTRCQAFTLLGTERSSSPKNDLSTYGDGRCEGPTRACSPRTQQTLLASVVDELEKVSRYSLNWDEFFGSSLDLAPSLLDLYDGIIASAAKEQEGFIRKDRDRKKDVGQLNEDNQIDDEIKTQNCEHNKVSSRQPRGASAVSTSPNGHSEYATSGAHKRTESGCKQQLPSLSVPPDRPVSMAEAEVIVSSGGGERGTTASNSKDTKPRRPLSLNTGTVPSLPPSALSLSTLRQRQQHPRAGMTINNIDENIIPENGYEDTSGSRGSGFNKCRGLCTKTPTELEMQRQMPSAVFLASESRNSVDSGCVLHIDGTASSNKSKDLKANSVQCARHDEKEESSETNKTSCSCYLYDNMSVSSSDTTGSGSFSYRDDVDSSTSSIRDGSVPLLATLSSSPSASSSSSPFQPAHDKSNNQDLKRKDDTTARRSITGLPSSVSESLISSSPASSTRRYNIAQHLSPSSLPLGIHYPNYQPLDERLATSPEATSKYVAFFSPANDSGLATDPQTSVSSTPGSRLSGPKTSPWSNSSSIASYTDDSNLTGSESPESFSPTSGKTSNIGARRSSSFSKTEARKRFFSNYEEHMRQVERKQQEQAEQTLLSDTAQSDRVVALISQGQHSSGIDTDKASSALETSNQNVQDTLPHEPSSSTTHMPLSSQSHTNRSPTSTKSLSSKSHSPPNSPRLSNTSSAGHRIPLHGPSSKSSKRRESSSTSSDVKPAGSGYVSYVHRVVAEILESERTYIASLKDIIQGYLEPMEQILGNTDAKEDLCCLFGNIREIFTFGCAFLADLELTSLDPVRVAECFVKHNKGFVIYTDYCTNYPRAVEILTRFMQHPDLSELCKERQLALGHGLPLGAYLLRPVQRILKYHLLLQNIVKNYEKEGGGGGGNRSERGSTSSTVSTSSGLGSSPGSSAILEQAFQHMTHMASHINEMKRKHEHAVRIQEIQSQLEDYVGEDLTRLGELVLESTFRVYGAKASRQVFLFERGLLISKKKEGGMLSCKTFIRCSNLMLVEVIPNEPLSFHTIPFDNPRAQYTLQARNMEQKRRWCQEIKRLILESFKGKIPDNVKSLVMQLGRNHDDDYVTKEALEAVRKNQHTAPEYLEKRRFRRKSGPRLPDFSLLKPQRAKKGANNKKGDTKVVEISKLSPEITRRAESKSPDSQRKFLIKQVAKKRSQSQTASLPTTPLSDLAYLELFQHPSAAKKNSGDNIYSGLEGFANKAERTKANTTDTENQNKHLENASALGNSTSSLSSISSLVTASVAASSPNSLNLSSGSSCSPARCELKVGQQHNDIGGNEAETLEDVNTLVNKRASSFRKAMRVHPITSADISELVVRCGGAGSLHLSPRKVSVTKSHAPTEGNQKASHIISDDKDKNNPEINSSESPSVSVLEESSNSNLVVSDIDESDNEEELQRTSPFKLSNEDLKNQISEVSRAISNGSFLSQEDIESDEPSSSLGHPYIDMSAQEKSRCLRSSSLPLLNDSDNENGDSGSEKNLNDTLKIHSNDIENALGHKKSSPSRKQCSHSVEDICGDLGNRKNPQSGQGRMSRRDIQDRTAILKKHSPKKTIKFSDQAGYYAVANSKQSKDNLSTDLGTAENSKLNLKSGELSLSDNAVLLRNKVKGLRLPNTHKHLSVQDYTSSSALRARTDASKARLIGWSSADKLTRGSMTDLGHLSEDPWIKNTDVLHSDDCRQSDGLVPRYPRHSATLRSGSGGEGSKENLDWLVYQNRNSTCGSSSSLKPISSLPSQFSNPKSPENVNKHMSSSLSDGINVSGSSQLRGTNAAKDWNKMSHATPPRAYMNLENMHKFEDFSEEKLINESRRNFTKSSQSILALNPRSTKITLARPIKLEKASTLSRSNSLPVTSCHSQGLSQGAVSSSSKNRHSSVQNVDHLSEQESAQRMIAEMEEYIKAVTEPSQDLAPHRCLPQKFPTSLPAITVEEGAEGCSDDDDDTRPPDSNRLSTISSVSTSSYESQGSSNSGVSNEAVGGMVGTLRHKLHTWAKESYPSDELEQGNNSSSDTSTIYHASLLTSDDEYADGETRAFSRQLDKMASVQHDQNRSIIRNTFQGGPETKNKTLYEERQLENVLREHSLGSSSLGLRMAKANHPVENTVLKEILPKSPTHSSSTAPEQEASPLQKFVNNNNESCKFESRINDWVSSSVCDVNVPRTKDIVGQSRSSFSSTYLNNPSVTRFSLPPTQEATEALMPAALRGDSCEIQQSDSGFSLQSTTSSSSDGSESSGDFSKLLDTCPVTKNSKRDVFEVDNESKNCQLHEQNFNPTDKVSDDKQLLTEMSNKSACSEQSKEKTFSDSNMKRSESCNSMESTDSFYERRLSVAFESDDFSNLPSVLSTRQDMQFDSRSLESGEGSAEALGPVTISLTKTTSSWQTFPLVQTDVETPLCRKSIREYVQSIEEMFKPQSPKVMEVRRREPGAMIRERLQNLRDQVIHGRRDTSEERGHGYVRSKSQPPSQHRSGLLASCSQSSLASTASGCAAEGIICSTQQPRSSDDIAFKDCTKLGSRDSLVSLSNGLQASTVWGSKESVFFPSMSSSRLKDRLASLSRERLHGSREFLLKDKRTSSMDLMHTNPTEPITRESILASPVLARRGLANQHQHQDSLLSPPITPKALNGDRERNTWDTRCSMSSPTTSPAGSLSHWSRKNQFVHRARSTSDRSSVSLSERSSSPVRINSDAGTRGVKISSSFTPSSPLLDSHQHLSRSTGRLDQMSTEVDNLVIMKGWVRSLISKFQDQT